ncbi:HlyD family secretion protein [Parapedobacter sp. GCM10030251]|uniref:HlyD family secretion protein n=1 Tax=Parapedobacter sp. GCM10030251 TaxID=3273419 RepID=UPI003616B5AC
MKRDSDEMKFKKGGFLQTTLYNGQEIHTEDIQDIIGTPPSALLRWGITWVFVVVVAIVALSAFVRYPEIVRTNIRINAANAPKTVISKVSGNLVAVLVNETDSVNADQPLAWMESTADHKQVLDLLAQLHSLRDAQQESGAFAELSVNAPTNLQLGELQNSYQSFYQSYLNYQAATGSGIYLKRREYILQDIQNVREQRTQLEYQRKLQEREYALAEGEFKRYEELAERKVISPAEFQQQRAALLAKQHPLQQTQSTMLASEATLTAKMKELADLDNQIGEEKSKFIQALNSFISESEQWKNRYVLTSPQSGTVVYAGIIQQNQHIDAGQEVFYVNPGSTDFFGELNVPQYNMGKVHVGQEVLVKLNSYPFEEFGVLKGEIGQINKVPHQDSIFLSRVDLLTMSGNQRIQLTTGLTGSAEIITEDASLLQRLSRNIKLLLGNK